VKVEDVDMRPASVAQPAEYGARRCCTYVSNEVEVEVEATNVNIVMEDWSYLVLINNLGTRKHVNLMTLNMSLPDFNNGEERRLFDAPMPVTLLPRKSKQ
jgi:hypothetical protein